MDIQSAFPSRYMKAADLPQPKTLTIRGVEIERMQDGTQKPAVSFHESEQLFILNKTNANALEALFGRDTNFWANQRVNLYQAEAEFQGRRIPCIRCQQAEAAAATPAAPAAPAPAPADQGNVPF